VMAHTGLLAHERVEVEDTVAAVVRFESGALATLHATTAAYPGLTVRLQVLGDAGSAVIDDDRLRYFHSRELASGEATGDAGVSADRGDRADQTALVLPDGEDADPVHGPMFTGHARQYRDIVEAIRTGRRPGVTLDDALLALATVQAVYESARAGAPVRVADVLAAVEVPVH
jgi:UDP-N-acetyl-2-amino-2-deoxyglucuronate dehydrogenase